MTSFDHLKRCFELTDEDVALAVESREGTHELLRRMAEISQPNGGVAKLLLVFARLATTACDWLDGDLRIEISGTAESSSVELLSELGQGMRERLFPPLSFRAAVDEFTRAVERVPHMVKPLEIKLKSAKRLSLGVTEEVRRSSLPPPAVAIAEDSFFVAMPPPAAKAPLIEQPDFALPVITPQLPIVAPARRKAKSSRPPVVAKAVPPRLPLPLPGVKIVPKPSLPRPAPKLDPRSEPDDEAGIDSGWDDAGDS